MSHRNSKKSNRIGQSIQKHRAQRNSPFEAEASASMDREYRNLLTSTAIPAPIAQPTPESITPPAPVTPAVIQHVTPPASKADPANAPVTSNSATELSTFNSQLASSSESPSPSELSTLNSQLPLSSSAPSLPSSSSSSASPRLCVKDTVPQSLSAAEHQAARNLIASKPATKAMHKLQSLLDNHNFDYLNPADVAQLSALMVVYAQLQNSAAVERISESLDQVGAGYKREPLTRELTKVLSIQYRALARAQREKAAIERDQRRIERELKRDQAQAAKQARDERLFNQRENHLTRKEKMVKDQLEIELNKRANLSRDTVNKHTKPQGAKDAATKSQDATTCSGTAS